MTMTSLVHIQVGHLRDIESLTHCGAFRHRDHTFLAVLTPEISGSLLEVIRCLKLTIFGDFRRQKTHLFGQKS